MALIDNFIKFLKKSNIDAELFMYYVEPEHNMLKFKPFKTIDEFFNSVPCEKWVENAFRWDTSEFNINDLIKLNEEWKEYCKKLNQRKNFKKIVIKKIKKLFKGD